VSGLPPSRGTRSARGRPPGGLDLDPDLATLPGRRSTTAMPHRRWGVRIDSQGSTRRASASRPNTVTLAETAPRSIEPSARSLTRPPRAAPSPQSAARRGVHLSKALPRRFEWKRPRRDAKQDNVRMKDSWGETVSSCCKGSPRRLRPLVGVGPAISIRYVECSLLVGLERELPAFFIDGRHGPAATRQENRWFWSIYVVAPARGHVKTDCPSRRRRTRQAAIR
jgi:hypothetical protein